MGRFWVTDDRAAHGFTFPVPLPGASVWRGVYHPAVDALYVASDRPPEKGFELGEMAALKPRNDGRSDGMTAEQQRTLNVQDTVPTSLDDIDTERMDALRDISGSETVFDHELGHALLSKQTAQWSRSFYLNFVAVAEFQLLMTVDPTAGEVSDEELVELFSSVYVTDLQLRADGNAVRPIQETYARIAEAYQSETDTVARLDGYVADLDEQWENLGHELETLPSESPLTGTEQRDRYNACFQKAQFGFARTLFEWLPESLVMRLVSTGAMLAQHIHLAHELGDLPDDREPINSYAADLLSTTSDDDEPASRGNPDIVFSNFLLRAHNRLPVLRLATDAGIGERALVDLFVQGAEYDFRSLQELNKVVEDRFLGRLERVVDFADELPTERDHVFDIDRFRAEQRSVQRAPMPSLLFFEDPDTATIRPIINPTGLSPQYLFFALLREGFVDALRTQGVDLADSPIASFLKQELPGLSRERAEEWLDRADCILDVLPQNEVVQEGRRRFTAAQASRSDSPVDCSDDESDPFADDLSEYINRIEAGELGHGFPPGEISEQAVDELGWDRDAFVEDAYAASLAGMARRYEPSEVRERRQELVAEIVETAAEKRHHRPIQNGIGFAITYIMLDQTAREGGGWVRSLVYDVDGLLSQQRLPVREPAALGTALGMSIYQLSKHQRFATAEEWVDLVVGITSEMFTHRQSEWGLSLLSSMYGGWVERFVGYAEPDEERQWFGRFLDTADSMISNEAEPIDRGYGNVYGEAFRQIAVANDPDGVSAWLDRLYDRIVAFSSEVEYPDFLLAYTYSVAVGLIIKRNRRPTSAFPDPKYGIGYQVDEPVTWFETLEEYLHEAADEVEDSWICLKNFYGVTIAQLAEEGTPDEVSEWFDRLDNHARRAATETTGDDEWVEAYYRELLSRVVTKSSVSDTGKWAQTVLDRARTHVSAPELLQVYGDFAQKVHEMRLSPMWYVTTLDELLEELLRSETTEPAATRNALVAEYFGTVVHLLDRRYGALTDDAGDPIRHVESVQARMENLERADPETHATILRQTQEFLRDVCENPDAAAEWSDLVSGASSRERSNDDRDSNE